MPEQWAVDTANFMKANRDRFQLELAALRAAGQSEDSVFVKITAEIIDKIDRALSEAAEAYGIEV